jgi:hypothetical protein
MFERGEAVMINPLRMKSWSPYVVGAGIDISTWFALATADKHLAITLQYEHIAALAEQVAVPRIEEATATMRLAPGRACPPRSAGT